MTQVWQHDCPGRIEYELVDGVIQVTCWVDSDALPPPERVTEGLQVLYTFEEGSGRLIHDMSGAADPLDLRVESQAAIDWLPGGGLSVNSHNIIASPEAALKISDAAKASNEITVEVWVKPANITQDGPARMVTLSTDFHHRNFSLAQAADLYDVALRTSDTTDNGDPSLSTPAGSLSAELTHVTYTREASGMARVYIDGAMVVEEMVGGDFATWEEEAGEGDFSNWDDEYRLALANELIGSRPWLGEFHLVAIYDRALTLEEVAQNFEATAHGQ